MLYPMHKYMRMHTEATGGIAFMLLSVVKHASTTAAARS